jgi:16S rRNA (cytosine967-C5)-methyltransferase
MLAAPLLGADLRGLDVLDLCAAPGGKTGQLWEAMRGEGRLVALEIDPRRRETLRANLERLYAPHAIEIPDLSSPDQFLARLPAQSCFDRILIDAPCLALGLIGRHPEVRWDGRLQGIEAAAARQNAILTAGARLARPGALLAWVTCSPTREENEGVLASFLAAHPTWRIVDPPPASPWLQATAGTLRTRPDQFPGDGFAMTLLRLGA